MSENTIETLPNELLLLIINTFSNTFSLKHTWEKLPCAKAHLIPLNLANKHFYALIKNLPSWAKSGPPSIEWFARTGHLELLQWSHSLQPKKITGQPSSTLIRAARMASLGGHLNILKWMKQTEIDHFVWSSAAASGSLETLEWLLSLNEKKHLKSENVCTNAAYYGHLEVLQWARKRQFPWNASVVEAAAENGHLEVLEWAIKNNSPSSNNIVTLASMGGHFHIVLWAIQWGQECNPKTCLKFIAKYRQHYPNPKLLDELESLLKYIHQ